MQETLYIGQWLLSSPSKWEPWDLTQFSQLPLAALSYFPESHWLSEIFSLSKVILVLGKDRSCRAPDLGCRGTESPGWFDVSPKKLCRRLDAWAGPLCWSCPSPVAHSCSLLYHPNSFRRGIFKLNAKFDADSVLYSVSHFECDGHIVHVLTQQCLPPLLTSTGKLSSFTHMHASPLSLAARLHRCCAKALLVFWTDLVYFIFLPKGTSFFSCADFRWSEPASGSQTLTSFRNTWKAC